MQQLQSPNYPEKPRMRAACDACRQSKVRCSGGQVCVRCEKHDFQCAYSIASRAGKPKGSKNKAKLKKLENIQVSKRNASSKEKVAAWTTAPKVPSNQNPLDRRGSDSASAAMHYDMAWPSQGHTANRTNRKYSLPGRANSCISPISFGYRPYTWEGGLSIDLESFGSMETPYMSPVHSQYMQSPDEESTNWSSVRTEPVTPVDLCGCMRRQALSENKLYNLGRDPSQWLFEPTIDVVISSLSSCQSLFNCALCSKETNNLLAAISSLDRLFAVLAQTVFQAVPASLQDSSMGRVPCTVPRDRTPTTRKSLVDRSLKTARETLDLLKGLLDPSVDLYTVNGNVEMPPFTAFANTNLTQKNSTNQAWGIFGQDTGTVEQHSPSIFEGGNPRNVDSGHMAHLREFACRYESMLENLRVAVSYNIAPKPTSTLTTAASFGLQAAWIPNVFGTASAPQVHYPSPTQPFPHSGSAYNVVGF